MILGRTLTHQITQDKYKISYLSLSSQQTQPATQQQLHIDIGDQLKQVSLRQCRDLILIHISGHFRC